jgi:hypothetical protein
MYSYYLLQKWNLGWEENSHKSLAVQIGYYFYFRL